MEKQLYVKARGCTKNWQEKTKYRNIKISLTIFSHKNLSSVFSKFVEFNQHLRCGLTEPFNKPCPKQGD